MIFFNVYLQLTYLGDIGVCCLFRCWQLVFPSVRNALLLNDGRKLEHLYNQQVSLKSFSTLTFVLCGAAWLSAGKGRDLLHRIRGCFGVDCRHLHEGFCSLVTRVATVLLSRWTDGSLWGCCPLIALLPKSCEEGPAKQFLDRMLPLVQNYKDFEAWV